jgi:hypothetical protein
VDGRGEGTGDESLSNRAQREDTCGFSVHALLLPSWQSTDRSNRETSFPPLISPKVAMRTVRKLDHSQLMRKRDTEVIITLSPRNIVSLFLSIIAFLIASYLLTQALMHFGGHDTQHGFAHQFDLDDENNVPTWYSSAVLLLCSLLLCLIWKASRQGSKRYAVYWLALSVLFLWLSLDEAASFHEMMEIPARTLFPPGPYITVAWVIPATFFALIVGVSLWRFLASLPPPIRRLFLLAGFLYVGGAIGMEVVESYYYFTYGKSMVYSLTAVGEEGLEMLGILVFFHALLAYLENHSGPVKIVFKRPSEAAASTTDPLGDSDFANASTKSDLPIPVATPRLE